MTLRPPLPGVYFRKGHFDDRLLDGLITVKISVAIVTPLGVEEKELTFSASDILTAITAMLAAISNLGGGLALSVDSAFGGDLPSSAQQRALPPVSALAPE